MSAVAPVACKPTLPTPGAGQPPSPMSAADLAEVLGAFNDVTARLQASHEALRAEVARLQSELHEAGVQLERSRRLAALGEMAAGIAHEVRNPLGSIRLYARMLETDLAAAPAQQELAVKIGAGVRVVDAIVRDVLAFARETRVTPEPVDVEALVERAIEESIAADRVDSGPDAAPIRVVRRGGIPAELALLCDAPLMHRALTNVTTNALQAMRDAAASSHARDLVLTVEVLHRCVEGAARRDRDRGQVPGSVVIAVSDTGPGVSPEVAERMFNPFFTTRAAGTGLGLAIVHRIIDAHGGSVSVRNRIDGPGAIVELCLPAQRRVGAEGAADRSSGGLAGSGEASWRVQRTSEAKVAGRGKQRAIAREHAA